MSILFRRPLLRAAGALIAVSGLSILVASFLLFVRSRVINIEDQSAFSQEFLPGFVTSNPRDLQAIRFGDAVRRAIGTVDNPFQRAIAVRHWAFQQQPKGDSWKPVNSTVLERILGDSDDPFQLLSLHRMGSPVNCRRFSMLFTSAAVSVGIQSRVVIASENFRKPNTYSHVMSEVWLPDRQNWVLMDPLRDSTFLLHGQPASLLQIYQAARSSQISDLQLKTYAGVISPVTPIAAHNMFRHIFISGTNAYFEGYRVCFRCSKPISFAHLTTPTSPNYPEWLKLNLVRLSAASGVGGFLILITLAWRSLLLALVQNSFIVARSRRIRISVDSTLIPSQHSSNCAAPEA